MVSGQRAVSRPAAACPRVAIVGAGRVARMHARAIRAAGGAVGGVLVAPGSDGAAAARRVGAERALGDMHELLSLPDVDVVDICTPNVLHREQAALALAAGKAVVCEKPLATSGAEALRLSAEAERAGVLAAVPFVYRFYPSVRLARERVRAGLTGRLSLLHGSYLQDWLADPDSFDWRVEVARGGRSRTFADIGVHWCDLMEFVTGERIVRVNASLSTTVPERAGTRVDTEDTAAVLFATDGGATGAVVLSQVSLGHRNRLWFSFEGERESLAFNQESPEQLWIGGAGETRGLFRGAAEAGAETQRYSLLPPGHPQGYQDCFNAFFVDCFAALRGETPPGLPTFADGARAAVLTDAVLASAAAQTWMEVP